MTGKRITKSMTSETNRKRLSGWVRCSLRNQKHTTKMPSRAHAEFRRNSMLYNDSK